MPTAPTRELSDGHRLPLIGLGTWPLDDEQAEEAVGSAIDLGYRLVDTAARYENERGVGRGIEAALARGVPREELVVTTKLRGSQHGYDEALAGFEQSRAQLGLDRIDLFLIHWPLPLLGRWVDTWRALVHLREQGFVRSIGVSNFTTAQIERLVAETGVAPAVNQIELHPGFAQTAQLAADDAAGVVTEAWSPLGRGDPLRARPVTRIASAHAVTPAQVLLRWHVQRGSVPVPKSADPLRQAENLEVFDFELSAAEMEALAALDNGARLGGDPEVHEEF